MSGLIKRLVSDITGEESVAKMAAWCHSEAESMQLLRADTHRHAKYTHIKHHPNGACQ
jgi:hypothetical protein